MNPELQRLVLAFEAVNAAGAGDEAKRMEDVLKAQMEDVLKRHPGIEY